MSERKILCEQTSSSSLRYINEQGESKEGRRYLGRFEGIAADLNNKTRNGRKYPLELWEKVIESEDFKDGMKRKVIFGEAGHPADRLETDLNKIAICLSDMKIKEDEGIVWASFDILDTEAGRLIKSLCDYGSQLGISSRGSGEEVADENGETIIDPDTYYFVCFDSVIMPAVSRAIPTVTESVDLEKSKSLVESITSQIESATSANELNSIKAIVEAVKIPECDQIIESINNKLSTIDSGDNISEKLISDINELSSKLTNLTEDYNELKKLRTADNIRYKKLRESYTDVLNTSRSLRKKLEESRSRINEIESDLVESANQCSEFSDSVKSLKTENTRIRERLRNRINESRDLSLTNESYKSELDSANEEISNLKMELSRARRKHESYESNLNSLSTQLESISKENQNLKSENKSLSAKFNKAASEYLKVKSLQSGVSCEAVRKSLQEGYSISDIDSAISHLSNRSDRMRKMPISIPVSEMSVSYPVNESFDPDNTDNDEDSQTQAIIKGMLK